MEKCNGWLSAEDIYLSPKHKGKKSHVRLSFLSVYLTTFNHPFEVGCSQDMELKWVHNYRSVLLPRPQDWVQPCRPCSKIQPSRLRGGSSWNNLREWRLASYPLQCRHHVKSLFFPLRSFSIPIHPFTELDGKTVRRTLGSRGPVESWCSVDLQYFHTENKLFIFIKCNVNSSNQMPRINKM